MSAANPVKRESITSDIIEFDGIAAILHPRHCEERKRRSNPFLRLRRDGLLRSARNDGTCGTPVAPLEIEEYQC